MILVQQKKCAEKIGNYLSFFERDKKNSIEENGFSFLEENGHALHMMFSHRT